MHKIIKILDSITAAIGKLFAWLVLVMVVVMFANVVLRYGFGVVYPKAYQAVNWSFGIVLTICAGYALLHDDHVRVDVFYSRASKRTKALIDLLGSLLLLAPFLYILWNRTFPYVKRSWISSEGPQDISGIPAVYILKSFLLVFVVALAIQGLALALKSLITIFNTEADHGQHT